MRRGDLVPVAVSGDFGKPRPALVIQSDRFDATATVTVLLLSSDLIDAPLIRLDLAPTQANGLQKPSQIMVDKTMTLRRDKIGTPFGQLDAAAMRTVGGALALFLGFA